MAETKLLITQIKSGIGHPGDHKRTLRALGLHGIGTSRLHSNTPVIRGMAHKVAYLLRIEEDKKK